MTSYPEVAAHYGKHLGVEDQKRLNHRPWHTGPSFSWCICTEESLVEVQMG